VSLFTPQPATIAETERLRLRELVPGDLDALAELLGDPETLVHWPRPLTREEAEGWIADQRRRYAEDGIGLWAAELRETGAFLGDCGLAVRAVEGVQEVELGYHLHRRHWGNGYATEAAIACRGLAEQRGLTRVVSLILPANVASERVAQRVGLRPEREVVHANMLHVLWTTALPFP
jgi:RimJ/RimL family protein N-acetyltransferase